MCKEDPKWLMILFDSSKNSTPPILLTRFHRDSEFAELRRIYG